MRNDMFSSPIDSDRFDRYLAGESDPGERSAVEQVLASSLVDAAIASAVTQPPAAIDGDILDRAWAQVLTRAGHVTETSNGQRGRLGRRSIGWGVGAIGAVAVLALAVVGRGVARYSSEHTSPLTHARVYATKTGERLTVTLADHSRLTLAPQSTLEVADQPGRREVTLEGEAYFDVDAKLKTPFVVHAGRVTARVLETTFDVRHYADDREVHVAVVTGKVTAGGRKSVALTAGMVGRFTDSTGTASVGDVTAATAWRGGALVFRAAPLPQVLTTLSRWYGMHFQVADSALNRAELTGQLDYGSRTEIIAALETLLDVRATVEMRGTTSVVTLYAARRTNAPAPQRDDPSHSFTPNRDIGR